MTFLPLTWFSMVTKPLLYSCFPNLFCPKYKSTLYIRDWHGIMPSLASLNTNYFECQAWAHRALTKLAHFLTLKFLCLKILVLLTEEWIVNCGVFPPAFGCLCTQNLVETLFCCFHTNFLMQHLFSSFHMKKEGKCFKKCDFKDWQWTHISGLIPQSWLTP